ncbi:hypothetical protein Acsp06_45120 [Actinomycetospora sp. NBRC 106375]|uniref:hypothetical protein n=1 Tax=Actinomycetospora sp. NBRC 106375 TaxID=3032207 RepID=UPI0024A113E3|nr:hypothetical protein [Actinomycetospora sp. NBRC 106375]GLZ48327.1 hypothetical protein Acsp06_45120 [Actinomycetospora sp. NBRC 106375]
MRRAGVGVLAVLLLAVAGCGVDAESDPEPLPPTTPVVLTPSVTQEPAPPPTVR